MQEILMPMRTPPEILRASIEAREAVVKESREQVAVLEQVIRDARVRMDHLREEYAAALCPIKSFPTYFKIETDHRIRFFTGVKWRNYEDVTMCYRVINFSGALDVGHHQRGWEVSADPWFQLCDIEGNLL